MHKRLFALGICAVGILGLVAVRAQQKPTLTAMDYIEIQQLANRYAQAIDSCSNNGYDYADLFTPDGEFVDNITEEGFAKDGLVRAKGREQLAAAAGRRIAGVQERRLEGLEPPDGEPRDHADAGGSHRTRLFGDNRREGSARCHSFRGYEDQYVKTSAGWRIKKRTHVRNKAWSNPLLQSADLN